MSMQPRCQIPRILAICAGACLPHIQAHSADGAVETTMVRIAKNVGVCIAPQSIAGESQHADGFTDVQFGDQGATVDLPGLIGYGDTDFSLDVSTRAVQTIDNGAPATILGSVHVGRYELFAREDTHRCENLKGTTVGMQICGIEPQAFLIAIAGTVGYHVLRLHEAHAIKATPQKIIAESTDWRFLQERTREPNA